MFKWLIFACVLAFAAAKPGYLAPAYSTYSAPYSAPLTYAAPLTYSGSYAAPYAYSSGYSTYAAPFAYSGYSGYRPLGYNQLYL